MMNHLFRTALLAMLTLALLPVSAQNDANQVFNVSIGELSYTSKQPETVTGAVAGAVLSVLTKQHTQDQPGYADAIRAEIVKSLGRVRRFAVTDGTQVAPGQSTAILIDGVIGNISTTTRIGDKDRSTEYKAEVLLTLNIKDAATGQVYDSHTFTSDEFSTSWLGSTDNAMRNTISSLGNYITRYYNRAYPNTARILERGDEKKDKTKQVYIDLGRKHNIYSGIHFTVYVIGSVAGRDTQTEIAKLKVDKVEGDDISLCKVQSGGKNIKAALDGHKKMLIQSTD